MKSRSVPAIMREEVVVKNLLTRRNRTISKNLSRFFGGGKIKICDTLRAVTPFGGLSVLIEFLQRIGLVEQLRLSYPDQLKRQGPVAGKITITALDRRIRGSPNSRVTRGDLGSGRARSRKRSLASQLCTFVKHGWSESTELLITVKNWDSRD